jgi:hypothetical protein
VLARSGQTREAREKTAQAVELYRGLASDEPNVYLPSLMASQSRLAVLVVLSGEAEEAIHMINEAEFISRQCRPSCPTWTLVEWAKALGALARHFRSFGSGEQALSFATQEVAAWHKLVVTQARAFLPDLGRALCRLAAELEENHLESAALASWAEAEEVYRTLARVDPGNFLQDLSVTFLSHPIALGRNADWETALLKSQQAEMLFESLAATHPEAFLPLWARALVLEGTCHHTLPHRAHEIEHYGRAVIRWCTKVQSQSTIAGAVPNPECERARSRPVAGV